MRFSNKRYVIDNNKRLLKLVRIANNSVTEPHFFLF